jgi:hypothetical protein
MTGGLVPLWALKPEGPNSTSKLKQTFVKINGLLLREFLKVRQSIPKILWSGNSAEGILNV